MSSKNRPRRTNAAESVVLMTPRNTDAIGSQPCESMVCKFPPTQSEDAGLGEHNQCLLELRLLDHWQRICGHQRVLRSLGRSSGSCLGENLCGVAPSKRHFLREMAGEANPPLDNGLALGAAIVAESIGSLRDKNEFPSLMTILHRKVLRYLLRISANDGLYILPKELAGCEGRLFLRQPVQKRTRKYRMTVATAVCDRFIRAATQEVTRLSKIYLVKELDTAHSDRGRLGSPMTE